MVRRWVAVVAVACAAAWGSLAVAHPCGPSFAYGNAGFGAGYGGLCGVRSSCGPSWGGRVCGPWWRGGWRVGGWPDACGGGWWGGWPRPGFGGWCGATRWSGCESVFLSGPGGPTFFSGCTVPFVTGAMPSVGWPATWYPGYAVGTWGWYPYAVPAPIGVGPQFGPAGILPFLGAAVTPRATTAADGAPRAVALRAAVRRVNDAARRRAERLVATGDRRLREARAGAVADARAAADAYRRAAAAAPDDPDIRIREALALTALGDSGAADAAIARAVAIDGRLAAAPPRRDDLPPDPVFGDRPAGTPAPLVARGRAVLEEIGGAAAADMAWLAARWSDRWAGAASAVASR